MIDNTSAPSATVADGAMDLCQAPAKLCGKVLHIPLHGLTMRETTCCTMSLASSLFAVAFNTLFLEPAQDGTLDWDDKNFELFHQALGPRTAYRAHAGRVSAGTRQGNPGSSNASVLQSLAGPPTPAAVSGSRPTDKRSGGDGSDDEDNSRGKRQRVAKKKNDGPIIKVLCPFKLRYPDDPEFEGCRYHEWGRLVEHLVRRKHKPVDLCQRCGEGFTGDVEWEQHTTACDQVPTRVFETPICVGRDKVTAIKQLTTKGRSNRPTKDLYRELWIILFGNDPPVPAHTDWLRVVGDCGLQDRDSTPPEPGLPHNTGGRLEYLSPQPELHPWDNGNLPSPISLQALPYQELALDYVNPEQLQNTDAQLPQLPVMFNDSSEAPTYGTFTSIPSISTGTLSTAATDPEYCFSQCPPGWIPLDGRQMLDHSYDLKVDECGNINDEGVLDNNDLEDGNLDRSI